MCGSSTIRLQAPDRDFELVNILRDVRFPTYWGEYHRVMGCKGVSPDEAKNVVRSRATAVAALVLRLGDTDADAMLCGTVGAFSRHLRYVRGIVNMTALAVSRAEVE